MKYLSLVLLIVVGLELSGLAYDIPPPPKTIVVEPSGSAGTISTMSQTGTLVGGGLLAAALIIGGLWVNQKRKVKKLD